MSLISINNTLNSNKIFLIANSSNFCEFIFKIKHEKKYIKLEIKAFLKLILLFTFTRSKKKNGYTFLHIKIL